MIKIRTLLAMLLLGCMVFGLCACTGNNETPDDTTDGDTTVADTTVADTTAVPAGFTVTVVDGDGNTVSGVVVQICKDSCIPARTDDNGVATFNIEIEDGHKLSVMTCPEGYEYTGEAEIYLEAGATEYTLEISKVG